jgi:hypothetical protein
MNINAKTKARRVRLLAACLLFFAVADIIFPPPSCCCGVEGIEAYAASVGGDSRATSQAASVEKTEDAPQDKHDCATCDEDCFCCGHAIAVVGVISATIPIQNLLPAQTIELSIPTPPLRGTFRPPRLA